MNHDDAVEIIKRYGKTPVCEIPKKARPDFDKAVRYIIKNDGPEGLMDIFRSIPRPD